MMIKLDDGTDVERSEAVGVIVKAMLATRSC